jgi:DivIVA domain-containing protein
VTVAANIPGQTQERPWERHVSWTPTAIRTRTFPEVGRRRAYDRDAVSAFLREVATDMDASNEHISRLQAEIDRIKRAWGTPVKNDRDTQLRQVAMEAVDMYVRAQQQADQLVAIAQQESQMIVGGAEQQAAGLIDTARREADRAAMNYRMSAGDSYDPNRESSTRELAMMETSLTALEAARANHGAIASQFDAVITALTYQLQQMRSK